MTPSFFISNFLYLTIIQFYVSFIKGVDLLLYNPKGACIAPFFYGLSAFYYLHVIIAEVQ